MGKCHRRIRHWFWCGLCWTPDTVISTRSFHFMWLRPLLLWLCGLSDTNSANLQFFPWYLSFFKIFFVTSSLASASFFEAKYSLYVMLEFLPHRIFATYEYISSEYTVAWKANSQTTMKVLTTVVMAYSGAWIRSCLFSRRCICWQSTWFWSRSQHLFSLHRLNLQSAKHPLNQIGKQHGSDETVVFGWGRGFAAISIRCNASDSAAPSPFEGIGLKYACGMPSPLGRCLKQIWLLGEYFASLAFIQDDCHCQQHFVSKSQLLSLNQDTWSAGTAQELLRLNGHLFGGQKMTPSKLANALCFLAFVLWFGQLSTRSFGLICTNFTPGQGIFQGVFWELK